MKTKHLDAKQIEELKAAYYLGEDSKYLVEKYNIDIHANKLVQTFPLVEEKDRKCQYCKI